MKEIQGYLVYVPNEPDGRGLFHFTLEGAKKGKATFDSFVDEHWDTEGKFNKIYWTEKPMPCKIYSLITKEELL